MSIALSIVVPVFDEHEALSSLTAETVEACSGLGHGWELIFVDDGSTDGSWGAITQLAGEHPQVRGLRLRRNFGKSAGLAAGIEAARGVTIVTMDGDGQDDPAEIPAMLAKLVQENDLVSGWKRERQDPPLRRLASRVFNAVTSRLTGVAIHDSNCGLKAMRAECAHSLDIFGELHRFLPALAAQQGWRVTEVPVRHRPREHGRSRFGTERYLRGFLDLITVVFLGRYANRPLHLFGGLGLLLAFGGFGICVYLTIVKIGGESIGERPLLFLGVLLLVVGVQLGTMGLLGQMIATTRREGPAPIAETVGDGPSSGTG